MGCGILVPQPGIEPASLALQGEFLTTGPPGKFIDWSLKRALRDFPGGVVLKNLPAKKKKKESPCQCREQGFDPWFWEDFLCCRATKPVRPGACVPQQEMPSQ